MQWKVTRTPRTSGSSRWKTSAGGKIKRLDDVEHRARNARQHADGVEVMLDDHKEATARQIRRLDSVVDAIKRRLDAGSDDGGLRLDGVVPKWPD